MSILRRILGLLGFSSHANRSRSLSRTAARQKEQGSFDAAETQQWRDFDTDYRAASAMLKSRLDVRYPDNFHARLRTGERDRVDYDASRIDAIDQSSRTIAKSLRDGASVKQAAEDAARSVGL